MLEPYFKRLRELGPRFRGDDKQLNNRNCEAVLSHPVQGAVIG